MLDFRSKKIATPRRWTQGAIDCFRIGCICEGCPVNDLIGTRCVMKGAVVELVRRYGKPGIFRGREVAL